MIENNIITLAPVVYQFVEIEKTLNLEQKDFINTTIQINIPSYINIDLIEDVSHLPSLKNTSFPSGTVHSAHK